MVGQPAIRNRSKSGEGTKALTDTQSETLDAVLDQAAQWYARMDCGTGDQAEFEAWRDADPRHAAAFARMLGAAEQVNVVKPLLRQSDIAVRSRNTVSMSRRAWIKTAVAACALLVFGGAGYVLIGGGGRVSAMTAVGDQATRTLPDGGQLHINTDSKVQWRFNDRYRDVWLQRGEIALTIPNDTRPLRLHSAGQVVEVNAGKINVRLRNGALDLLVLEGKAKVSGHAAGGGAPVAQTVVSEGHAVLADDNNAHLRPMTADDIEFVSAWQKGQVYFNGETLGAAVEEYNRYLPYKIAIGDPSLQGIRLGGRFSSRDPKIFLASLHDAFAISANRTSDGSVVLTR